MFKKKGKIFICAMLIAVMLSSLTACGGQNTAEYNLEELTSKAANFLICENAAPVYGSIGGEWLVLGMSRYGGEVPEGWYETYYKNLEGYVTACEGKLDDKKYTEYSRVIIALTSIGENPADVGGYDLIQPLADFDKTVFQGINGPAYALLALDSGNYEIPAVEGDGTQATREMYVDYILTQEVDGGGWSFSGGPAEVDCTAIVLQALAKYQSREDVAAAIERGLTMMSEAQDENGGFVSYGMESSETVSQVIVALTELGIAVDDARFVKGGKTLLDKLMEFSTGDGGFMHTPESEFNIMSSEQAFCALVSLYLTEQGITSLYSIRPTV